MTILSVIALILLFALNVHYVACGTDDDNTRQKVTLTLLYDFINNELGNLPGNLNETQSKTDNAVRYILSKIETMDRRLGSTPTVMMALEVKLRETFAKTEIMETKLSDIYKRMDALERGINNCSKISTDFGRDLSDTQANTKKIDTELNDLYNKVDAMDTTFNGIHYKIDSLNRRAINGHPGTVGGDKTSNDIVDYIRNETSIVNMKVDNIYVKSQIINRNVHDIRQKTEKIHKKVNSIQKRTKNLDAIANCTQKAKTHWNDNKGTMNDIERKLTTIHMMTWNMDSKMNHTYNAMKNMEKVLNDSCIQSKPMDLDGKPCACNKTLDVMTADNTGIRMSDIADRETNSGLAVVDGEDHEVNTDPCQKSKQSDIPFFLQFVNDITQNIGFGFKKGEFGCSDHAGEEYILLFPYDGISTPELQIIITSRKDTIVDIESPYTSMNQNVRVNATEGRIVTIPSYFVITSNVQLRSRKGIMVRSRDSRISVYGVIISKSHHDIVFTAIPTKFLSTTYPVIDQSTIIAMNDDTLLNITYRDDQIQPTQHINEINKLRTRLLPESNWTHVKKIVSSNENIGVLSTLFLYPVVRFLFIPPIEALGSIFIVPQMNTSTCRFYIYSFENSECIATIKYNSLSYRNYYFRWQENHRYNSGLPSVVETSLPTILLMYSNDFSGLLIPAISQYSNHYKFLTPFNDNYQHQCIIIIKANDFHCLMFDEQPVRSLKSEIQTVDVVRASYDIIYLNISVGQHEVYHADSDVTFGLIAAGISSEQITTRKYYFPVGMYLGEKNCTNTFDINFCFD